MCVDVNVCLSTALPAPIVTISPASDVLTVGQSYTLTCNVMVVPHLVVEPTIQWTKYDGTSVITSSSSGTSLQLNFDPLQLSDGDIYTCTANINITDIETSVSSDASRDVIVMSKLYNIIRVEMILCLYSTVPQPTVVITRSHNDTVYVGTELILISSITFNDLTGVDVPLTVDIIWTRDDDDITSDTHITVSDVSGSIDTSYIATLIYSPITNDDSGIITATITVTPSEISQYIQTATVMTQDIMIDVQGIAYM